MISTNLKTAVKLLVDGINDQTFPRSSISYFWDDIESFQSHVMSSLRLFPGAPLYDCESICYKDAEINTWVPMTIELLGSLLSKLNADILSGIKQPEQMKLLVDFDRVHKYLHI
jgi:hypothetical protein